MSDEAQKPARPFAGSMFEGQQAAYDRWAARRGGSAYLEPDNEQTRSQTMNESEKKPLGLGLCRVIYRHGDEERSVEGYAGPVWLGESQREWVGVFRANDMRTQPFVMVPVEKVELLVPLDDPAPTTSAEDRAKAFGPMAGDDPAQGGSPKTGETTGLWSKRGDKGGKYLVLRRDNTIPSWPYFVMGARDPFAPAALRAYALAARDGGANPLYVGDVEALADDFERYRLEHGAGDPDAVRHRKDDPAVVARMKAGA